MKPISQAARTFRVGDYLVSALRKICKVLLLGLLPIAMVIPGREVALSQGSTGSAFTTIDVPNATTGTAAYGINNAGQIVGFFGNASGGHGFLREAGGTTWTTIDVPNTTNGTQAFGINDTGQIVGIFVDASGQYGFLREAGGTMWTTIDGPNTFAYGINNSGQIVGSYLIGAGYHGFLRGAGGTSFSTIDPPNPGTHSVEARGINNAGQIVGRFIDGSGFHHGFLRDAGGTFTTIDYPGQVATYAYGINDTGQIVGIFLDATTGLWRSFLRDAGGTFITIDVPNATTGTQAWGINNAGQIVGIFGNASGGHGFVRSKPPVITIDAGHGRLCWPIDPPWVLNQPTGTSGPSPNSLAEDDLALTIAHSLALDLTQRGYTVIETRTDQCLLAPPKVKVDKDGNRYLDLSVDLRERVRRSRELLPVQADMFISIHFNGGDASVNGTEVWIDPLGAADSGVASEALAGAIAAAQGCLSTAPNTPDHPCLNPPLPVRTGSLSSTPGVKYSFFDTPWEAITIYVLRGAGESGMVGALDEVAFLTNAAQQESLRTAVYQQQVVRVISGAIRTYLKAP
jgi:N-acetylmuramoyl-L-alanine amidase